MISRDYLGWPVEYIKGRPITNFIRFILHTDVNQTWRLRNNKDYEKEVTSESVTQMQARWNIGGYSNE